MDASLSSKIMKESLEAGGSPEAILEYLVKLQTEKFKRQQAAGSLDFKDLQSQLRELELDISMLKPLPENVSSSTGSPPEKPPRVKSVVIDNEKKVKVSAESHVVYDTLPSVLSNSSMGSVSDKLRATPPPKEPKPARSEPVTRKSFDEHQLKSKRDASMSVQSAELIQSAVNISTLPRVTSATARHGSVHLPLYTVPNAFNYNIKLRDTNTTGVSTTDSNSIDHFAPASIQGSKERRSDIQSITDKFTADRLSEFGSDSFSSVNNNQSQSNISTLRHSDVILAAAARPSGSESGGGGAALDMDLSISMLASQSGDTVVTSENTTPTAATASGTVPAGADAFSAAAIAASSDPAAATVAAAAAALSSPPPPTEEDESSILEFCVVEADFNSLVRDDLKFISPLLPPRETWKYPQTSAAADNNTQLIQTQSFFFPSGVPVDFVAPSVVPLLTRKCNYKRHIVPFMDVKGVPNYACCLTVTQAYSKEDIRRIHEKIVTNLIKINQMKHAVHTIQKVFRHFIVQQKLRNWNNPARNNGIGMGPSGGTRQSSMTGAHNASFNAGRRASETTSSTNSNGAAAAPKPSMFSRFFSRRTSSELDSSAHQGSTTTATPSLTGGSPLPNKGGQQGVAAAAGGGTVNRTISNVSTSPDNNNNNSSSAGGSPRKSLASDPAVETAIRQTMTENINNKLAAAGGGPGGTLLNRDNLTKSIKDILLTLVTYHALSPADVNEIISHILDKITLTSTSSSSSSAASAAAAPFVTEMLTSSATPVQIKQRILHLIALSSLSSDDLNEILTTITSSTSGSGGMGGGVTPGASPRPSGDVDGGSSPTTDTNSLSEPPSSEVTAATSVTPTSPTSAGVAAMQLSYSAAEMETALRESLSVALAARYDTNRVVVAQKAYCIITAASEYTFIFKVLDAIAEAETKLNPYTLSGEVERLRANSASSSGSAGGGSGSSNSKPTSPLAAMFSPSAAPTVEANRLQFLDQIQSFMVDNYFSAKCNSYQLQDLSLNFTLPKQKYNTNSSSSKRNGGAGGINRAESVNKLLNKYATIAQQEAKSAAGGGGGGAWTTPAQQMFSHHPTSGRSKAGSNEEASENNLDRDDFQLGRSSTGGGGFSGSSARGESSNRESTELCLISVPNYVDYFLIDKRSMLTTKEWSCAVLFAHLNSQVVFKIINLLLMEKSLIIYGKNPGIVTSITLAVINLISPFVWEGIFVPLVPDNARELFGAPVPLILGTISPPRIADVSSSTAILYLNDDIVIHTPVIKKGRPATTSRGSLSKYSGSENNASFSASTSPTGSAAAAGAGAGAVGSLAESGQYQSEFLAWFVRLPEVTADMPLDEEISRRIEYVRLLLCNRYIKQMDFTERSNQKSSIYSDKPTSARSSTGKNVMDFLLMSNVPSDILKHIQILITAIKRNNFNFCGNVIKDPASWKKFLKYSSTTGEEEFYPEQFMEPLRNYLEFQESIANTQLFVAFMDKLKKEQQVLDHVRKFIGHWIYFRVVMYRKNQVNNRKRFSSYEATSGATATGGSSRRSFGGGGGGAGGGGGGARPLAVKLDLESSSQFVAYNGLLLNNLKNFH